MTELNCSLRSSASDDEVGGFERDARAERPIEDGLE